MICQKVEWALKCQQKQYLKDKEGGIISLPLVLLKFKLQASTGKPMRAKRARSFAK